MLETLISAAGGGFFGLIGAGFTKFMGYKEKQLAFKHEADMAVQDRLNMDKEMELARTKGKIDLELTESENDAKNLQAAINAEGTVTTTSPWVADLRGSTRPLLTYGLVVASLLIIILDKTNPWVNEFVFMAMTAVTFWFGSRPMSRK